MLWRAGATCCLGNLLHTRYSTSDMSHLNTSVRTSYPNSNSSASSHGLKRTRSDDDVGLPPSLDCGYVQQRVQDLHNKSLTLSCKLKGEV